MLDADIWAVSCMAQIRNIVALKCGGTINMTAGRQAELLMNRWLSELPKQRTRDGPDTCLFSV